MKKTLFLIIMGMLVLISVAFAKHVESKCCEKFTRGSPGERDCLVREHGQGFMLASGQNYCCSGPSNKWLVQGNARDAYSNAVDYGGSQGTLCVEKEQCDYPKNAVLYCNYPNSPCGTPTEFPSRSYFSQFKPKLTVEFSDVTYYEMDTLLCLAEWLPIAVIQSEREREWAVDEGSIVLNYQFENLRTKKKNVLCGVRPARRTNSYYGSNGQSSLCKDLDCVGGDTIKCTVYATANDRNPYKPTATWGEAMVQVHSLQERCNNGNKEPEESDADCGGICVDRLVPASQKRCRPYQQCNNNDNYCQEGMSCEGGRCIYHSYIDYFRGINNKYRVVVERNRAGSWTEVFSAQGNKVLSDYPERSSKRLHPTAKDFDNGASSLQDKLNAFPLRDGGLYRISVDPTNAEQPHAQIGYSFFQVCGDETCNGADDNCNGVIDDGLTACACKDGAKRVREMQETCNGVDDDCNEQVDEGFSTISETCNGQDDNCDGIVDNIPPDQIPLNSKQQGPCAGKKQRCSATGFVDDYSGVVGYEATETLCDTKDDDCDGHKDKDDGVRRCQCGDTTAPLSEEVCNNVDDNCNGQIDEQLITCGCKDGAAPTTETCNNKDDDCDGTVDEENVCGGLPAPDASWTFDQQRNEEITDIPMVHQGVTFEQLGTKQGMRITPNTYAATADYAQLSPNQKGALELRDAFTIEGWFWLANVNQGFRTLLAKTKDYSETGTTTTQPDGSTVVTAPSREHYALYLSLRPDGPYGTEEKYGTLSFAGDIGIGKLGAFTEVLSFSLAAKKWYHFTMVYVGDQYSPNKRQVKFFINNQEKQRLVTNPDHVIPLSPNTDPLYFGFRHGDSRGFDGALANIQIYKRALTPQEIQARYKFAHPNKCGSVVCADTELCDTTANTCKKKNGESCLTPLGGSTSEECFGGYCVHGTCAQEATICGDGYCDNEPTCSGDCPAGSPAKFESFSTAQEAALWDNLPRYTPNVRYSTEKKAKMMKGSSQSTYDATIQKRIHIPVGATQMKYKTWGAAGAGVFVTLDGEVVS